MMIYLHLWDKNISLEKKVHNEIEDQTVRVVNCKKVSEKFGVKLIVKNEKSILEPWLLFFFKWNVRTCG